MKCLRDSKMILPLVINRSPMSHPLNNTQFDPTWADPKLFEPDYGIGRVRATIFFKSILLGGDVPLERELDYSWQETINGIEVFIQNPHIKNASALEEDIREALRKKLKFDILNFID